MFSLRIIPFTRQNASKMMQFYVLFPPVQYSTACGKVLIFLCMCDAGNAWKILLYMRDTCRFKRDPHNISRNTKVLVVSREIFTRDAGNFHARCVEIVSTKARSFFLSRMTCLFVIGNASINYETHL